MIYLKEDFPEIVVSFCEGFTRRTLLKARKFTRSSTKDENFLAPDVGQRLTSFACMLRPSNQPSFHSASWGLRDLTMVLPQAAVAHFPLAATAMLRKILTTVSGWFAHKIKSNIKRTSYDVLFMLAPDVGLEPTTLRLTAACSAICNEKHQYNSWATLRLKTIPITKLYIYFLSLSLHLNTFHHRKTVGNLH